MAEVVAAEAERHRKARPHRAPRSAGIAGRLLRQSRHRHADAGGELRASRNGSRAAKREWHAGRWAISGERARKIPT